MEKISAVEFNELIIEEEEPSVVLFSRKTCHVCQDVHPIIEGLEKEYSGVHFYHVDVEEQTPLFQKYGGKGVPQVMTFAHGELVKRLAGRHDEDEYADQIEEII